MTASLACLHISQFHSMGPNTLDMSNTVLRAHCVVSELMAHCKCYGSILDVSLALENEHQRNGE